jgi:3-oxoacyl-[acyl-carrier protein] reductase
MDLGLENRTVIVTGASQGIGLAIVERFAREGSNVVMVARNRARLDEEAARVKQRFGVEACPVVADLSLRSDIDMLWKTVPVPDIIVNNAGSVLKTNLLGADITQIEKDVQLKLVGYIDMCQRALSAMSERNYGVIINIIGTSGERHDPEHITSTAINAALSAVTRSLGAASLKTGVRVVGVNPGRIGTTRLIERLCNQAEKTLGDRKLWRDLLEPGMQLGDPAHVADMAAFLASGLSGHTTGTIVTVDGGASARK